MKQLILGMMLILLVSCERRTEIVEVISYDVSVENPLQFDHKSGETVILMGKVVQAKDNNSITRYQYYIPAREGTWIETNQKFHLGDTLIMNGLQYKGISYNTSVISTTIQVNSRKDTLKRKR